MTMETVREFLCVVGLVLKIVVNVKFLGTPHVLRLCLGVSNGMLTVKYCHSIKPLFVNQICVCLPVWLVLVGGLRLM